MNARPQVSIIIPARNAEEFINRCLDSVLNVASSISLEVILILNGCDDQTAVLANAYAYSMPIQLHIEETALGPAAARNIGIQMSKGIWLYFLDADDLIPEGALDKHCEIMNTSKSDVLVGSYIKDANNLTISSHQLNGALKFDSTILHEYIIKYAYEPYIYTMPVHCWGKLYLRDSVMSAGVLFDESLDQLEDVNFNFSLILNGLTFEYTDQVLYHYHTNSGPKSLSAQSGDDPNALELIQVAYIPVKVLLEKWETTGVIEKASSYIDHLFATTTLLWLIRVGKKFGYYDWANCKFKVSQIVNNSDLGRSMRFYREMPGTSRVIPFLVRLKLITLLCCYFRFKAIINKNLPYDR
jgi:glycosyltransferase involved in cell wall biosynthesis